MDMIERVARALAFEHVRSEQHWPEWREAASAAIEAMREPTDEMVDAGGRQLNDQTIGRPKGIVDVYQAMVSAALNPSQT